MSNTTPTPSRDAADGSHFTIEDAGSMTDASDFTHNDTTAGLSPASAAPSNTVDEDEIASADAVAAAGPGPQAEGFSTAAGSSSHGTAVAATPAPSADADSAAAEEPQQGLSALIGDDSIAHVFDQTNGVIEGVDGDSDGTAGSDVLSRGERADEN